MLLKKLSMGNKEKFWKLANYLIASDGNLDGREVEMLSQYSEEMDYSGEIKAVSLEEANGILVSLDKNDTVQAKIIYVELVGLAYADSKFSKEEDEFLKSYREKFEIEKEEVVKIEEIIKTLNEAYKNIFNFIAKKS